MSRSCIIEPKSGEEMDAYVQKAPQSIIEFYWNKCGHCKKLTKTVEGECKGLGKDSPIPVLKCDVEKDWCKQRWAATKPDDIDINKYGVPQTVGISPQKGYGDPVWHIRGEKHDEIKSVFGSLKQAISKYKKQAQQGGGGQHQQQRSQQSSSQQQQPRHQQPQHQQPQQQQRARDPHYQRMAPIYNRMDQAIVTPPAKKRVSMNARPQNISPICFPPHCDRRTSDVSLMKYIMQPSLL